MLIKEPFNFNDLIVFEMANNHQGSVEHGVAIIREMGRLAKQHGVRAAVKLQFRQLDSFIHPDHQVKTDNKHIPRFLSTRLSKEQFKVLVDETRKQGLITMCTPFDEASVDIIEELEIEVIKVGSCSAKDWPLLERIAKANGPVIFSTGGLNIRDVDNLVSFFDHKGIEYAMMHCVSLYPIPDDRFHLNNIEMMRKRYLNKVIGWSTHEDPSDTMAVAIAVAKGARMLEKHVGLATDKIKLNAYSAGPDQVDKWLASYKKAVKMCGQWARPEPLADELDSLDSLARGIYSKSDVKAGEKLKRENVYFSMPIVKDQIPSGKWRNELVLKQSIKANQPLLSAHVDFPEEPVRSHIQSAVHDVKALLNEAGIQLSSEFKVEYSHHYGMENFRKVGCVLIECVNREYCKKIVVQLPGQAHPSHFHPRKEETFQVLYGNVTVELDGHERNLGPGDTLLVLPGVWHSFKSEGGCVFEEVSTTHFNNDSIYRDKRINEVARAERKTIVDHWGRFQISDKPAVIPKPV